MNGLEDKTKPYKDSPEYANNMVNIEYMKALDYSMYENSTADPAVKVYVGQDNTLNLLNDGRQVNTNYPIQLNNSYCPGESRPHVMINLQQCETTSSGTDLTKCGLYYNAQGLLNNVTRSNDYSTTIDDYVNNGVCEQFTVEPMTVNISNYKEYPNLIEEDVDDYETDALTAYNGNCKKYDGMKHCDMYVTDKYSDTGNCERTQMCDILEENINSSDSVTMRDPSGIEKIITLNTWMKTPATDFEGGVKKYNGMVEGDKCFTLGTEVDQCNFGITGQMRATFASLGLSPQQAQGIGELQNQAAEQEAKNAADIASAQREIDEFNEMSEGFQSFYGRYTQPLNNYVREEIPKVVPVGYSIELERVEERFHIENDLITSVYIGSISVLGLYMLYRLMEK
jgi:hypothetical protein